MEFTEAPLSCSCSFPARLPKKQDTSVSIPHGNKCVGPAKKERKQKQKKLLNLQWCPVFLFLRGLPFNTPLATGGPLSRTSARLCTPSEEYNEQIEVPLPPALKCVYPVIGLHVDTSLQEVSTNEISFILILFECSSCPMLPMFIDPTLPNKTYKHKQPNTQITT